VDLRQQALVKQVKYTVESYLAQHPVAKIQLGCGGNLLDGWFNTDGQCDGWFHPDGFRLDASQPFPIPNDTFDYVYSEHMIEHLDYWSGQRMLAECYRIAKPGAKVRITCPDFEFLIKLYIDADDLDREYMTDTKPEWAPYVNPIFTINNYVRDWGHKFIYDKPTLAASLQAAGFVDVVDFKIRESHDPVLQNLEADFRMKPGHLQLESMTLEAVKPV
jgi:predicted SAM-dependent methyltransferase